MVTNFHLTPTQLVDHTLCVCVPEREPPILVRGRVYGLAMSNVRFVTSSVGVGRLTWRLVSFVGHDITF